MRTLITGGSTFVLLLVGRLDACIKIADNVAFLVAVSCTYRVAKRNYRVITSWTLRVQIVQACIGLSALMDHRNGPTEKDISSGGQKSEIDTLIIPLSIGAAVMVYKVSFRCKKRISLNLSS